MPESSAEVAVSSVVPIVTVTAASASVPVFPLIVNPAAFSEMLIVLSSAIVFRFSTSAPAGCTVTVQVAAAWFQLASPAAVAVIMQSPGPRRLSAPVVEFTVHTAAGFAE